MAMKATLVLAGAAAAIGLLHPTEPEYEGRGLRSWLARAEKLWYRHADTQSRFDQAQVDHAVRQMGAESVPVLISMLKTKDGAIKRELMAISRLVPSLPIHVAADADIHARALLGFKILGAVASPAVAELAEMAAGGDGESAILAAQALARIGPAATNAVPVLVKNLNAQDITVRSVATNALKRIDPLAAMNAGIRIG